MRLLIFFTYHIVFTFFNYVFCSCYNVDKMPLPKSERQRGFFLSQKKVFVAKGIHEAMLELRNINNMLLSHPFLETVSNVSLRIYWQNMWLSMAVLFTRIKSWDQSSCPQIWKWLTPLDSATQWKALQPWSWNKLQLFQWTWQDSNEVLTEIRKSKSKPGSVGAHL